MGVKQNCVVVKQADLWSDNRDGNGALDPQQRAFQIGSMRTASLGITHHPNDLQYGINIRTNIDAGTPSCPKTASGEMGCPKVGAGVMWKLASILFFFFYLSHTRVFFDQWNQGPGSKVLPSCPPGRI